MDKHSKKPLIRQLLYEIQSWINGMFSKDTALFWSELYLHPQDIGSFLPSSSSLAEAMTRYINLDGEPKRFLEVGAGTGPLSEMIVTKLKNGAQLDIVEINPQFCKRLEEKYADNKNVSIHACSVLEWNPPYRYDAIVSSLPFNNLPVKVVLEVSEHYRKLLKKEGVLSFYEYLGFPHLKRVAHLLIGKKEYSKTLKVIKNFEEHYEVQNEIVFANVPPACVHHCKVS